MFADPDHAVYAEVVVDLVGRGLDRSLTYCVPDNLHGCIAVGSHVRVPLGKRTVAGYVVGLTTDPPPVQTKPLLGKVTEEDPLGPAEVELARWLAERYCCSLAAAVRCFAAPGSGPRAVRIVRLTAAGRAPEADEAVAGARRQQAALQALRQREAMTLRQLAACFGGGRQGLAAAASALRGLVTKGLAEEIYRTAGKSAQPRLRQVCHLVGQRDWSALLTDLRGRAPAQCRVISALLEAQGRPVPLAELPRTAVAALQKAGLVQVSQERVQRTPETVTLLPESSQFLTLNAPQQAVLQRVREALDGRKHVALLVHGVTGSGKTEVYLHSIEAALQAGRSAIVLVPEIALTPQAVGRFRARFGNQLALLHSGLSPGERYDEWDRVRRGAARIVVGARSAIFAPCPDLGVIVVDEEHEGAYKQDSEPRYAAQVVAARRAEASNAVLILGSATPSVEAYHAASTPEARLRLMVLPERIDNRPLPPVQIVDLRRESLYEGGEGFSEILLEGLRACIQSGEQAILFLNRRGFSTFVMCRECGASLRCPDCAVALTYHHRTRRMRCHHCDYKRPTPDRCENCEGYDIGFHGQGTERVADQVQRLVEGATVVRMDRDTTGRRGAHAQILRRFARGEANILVGTQMIAKGHDFPNVTLVGVLNADTGLNRPDFRAAEHTFQLLTQVAGRAGRADKPGKVIVQTYNPDHYAIVAASRHDYAGFYERELVARRVNRYPPFVALIKIGVSHRDEHQALETARRVATTLEEVGVAHKRGETHFLGPAEAPLHKLRGQYRYHMLIKGPDSAALRQTVRAALRRVGDVGGTTIIVDVDPMDMM